MAKRVELLESRQPKSEDELSARDRACGAAIETLMVGSIGGTGSFLATDDYEHWTARWGNVPVELWIQRDTCIFVLFHPDSAEPLAYYDTLFCRISRGEGVADPEGLCDALLAALHVAAKKHPKSIVAHTIENYGF